MNDVMKGDIMKGKVCIVTGANAGIGLETARGLAEQEATVVMICRSEERGRKALEDITSTSGNPDIHLMLADLASQNQIREVAGQFLERFDRLDVLVNNAGVFLPRLILTEDGYESTFAINHLAYFLLTHLLLDLLKATPSSRIVNVSSNAHQSGSIDFETFGDHASYNGYKAYGQSKMANVLFTYELARRLEGSDVTCNALHPGVVSTNIADRGTSLFSIFFKLFSPFFLKPKAGAETSLYLATSPEVAGVTGAYFTKKKAVSSSKGTYDRELAKKLWDRSVELTGIGSSRTTQPH